MKKTERRVLVIGDLHAPFTLQEYLPFCIKMYKKYRCNSVVLLGDLIENNFSSFHETDPDGHSAAEELRLAKMQLQEWYKAFPVAKVTLGNHDRVPTRKAFNAGLSSRWIKSIGDVLDTPGWEYQESFIIDGVLYCHGIGRKAHIRARDDMISVVQGHYHVDSKITMLDGLSSHLFSMQVGCGYDSDSYAAAYAKHYKAQAHNVGLVLRNGKLPILERMYE